MQKAEKKLGCLKGTARTNKPYIGYIEGTVNDASMPKGGKKQVSIIDKKVTFWAVNDFDVTVAPEDIVGCEVVGLGKSTGRLITAKFGEQTKKANEYGNALSLSFADGTSGVLEIKSFLAFSDIKVTLADKQRDPKLWEAAYRSPKYIPVVAGWLAPDGSKDEKYGDLVCPEGYTPDIVEFHQKAESSNKIEAMAEIKNVVQCKTKVSELCEALDLHTRFDGFSAITGNKDHVCADLVGEFIYIDEHARHYIRTKKQA